MVSVNLSDYCAGDDIHDDTAGFVAAHAAMAPNGALTLIIVLLAYFSF